MTESSPALSDTSWGIIAAAAIFVILAIVVVLRTRKIEFTLADVIIATVPVLLVLAIAGKIESLKVSPEGLALEMAKKAVVTATTTTIGDAVDLSAKVQYDAFQTGAKADLRRLRELAPLGDLGALSLQLGEGYYVPRIVRIYLETLSQSPRFRYLALLEPSGKLFGVIDARRLGAWLDGGGSIADAEERTEWLVRMRETLDATEGLKGLGTAVIDQRLAGQDPSGPALDRFDAFLPWTRFIDAVARGDRKTLEKTLGFVAGGMAITPDTSKREALRRMAEIDADRLPVTDEAGRLTGSVERAQLTAGIVLDMAANFEKLAGTAGAGN